MHLRLRWAIKDLCASICYPGYLRHLIFSVTAIEIGYVQETSTRLEKYEKENTRDMFEVEWSDKVMQHGIFA